MFDKFRKLGRIHKREEELMLDLLLRRITVEEYLLRYVSISSEVLEIGEIADSLESLTKLLSEKKFLKIIPVSWYADEIVTHEGEHA